MTQDVNLKNEAKTHLLQAKLAEPARSRVKTEVNAHQHDENNFEHLKVALQSLYRSQQLQESPWLTYQESAKTITNQSPHLQTAYQNVLNELILKRNPVFSMQRNLKNFRFDLILRFKSKFLDRI